MAITFVEKSQANWSGGSISAALPAGDAQNDLLIAQIVFDRTATTISAVPSGWALIPLSAGNNPQVQGTNAQSYWYYKIAGSGETDPAVWTPSDALANGVVCVSCYRGVDISDPFDQDLRTGSTASGTSHVTPTGTVTTANAWAVVYAATDTASTNSWTEDSGAGWTERYEQQNGSFVSGASADQQIASGTTSMTWTSSVAGASIVAIVMVKPGGIVKTLSAATETNTAQPLSVGGLIYETSWDALGIEYGMLPFSGETIPGESGRRRYSLPPMSP
jgi:hypothetical protein